MKILYFLSLVVFCNGLPLNSAPENVQTTTFINPDETELYFVVTWDKVESSDAADPILGYKVKVFEGKVNVTHVTKADGSKVTELDIDLENEPQEPSVEVAEIDVSADKNEYTYHNMKEKVRYEVAVQAYTAKSVGPESKRSKFVWA
ncbi:unnamed protein product [Arctia plantaginis]|uniref:Fibronectin type-III domain-containing protein n=1 Tax=Arctia plantaginis TaxID=874455 RepID=A0A8S0YTP3_ARCPL|nr:unnamed protein product [Arctia plantaginis]